MNDQSNRSEADGVGQEEEGPLTGSDAGSDTRAGSLRGGAATGSERDEAQAASNRYLADIGEDLSSRDVTSSGPAKGEPRKGLTNTGHESDKRDGPGDNADAAIG